MLKNKKLFKNLRPLRGREIFYNNEINFIRFLTFVRNDNFSYCYTVSQERGKTINPHRAAELQTIQTRLY